jgi:hypothetical protein
VIGSSVVGAMIVSFCLRDVSRHGDGKTRINRR